ncbi:hypothetical protein LL912_19030 [Niabella sp. CC-SYL272]|uniref:hypothetical protein n=1 Tax=Niabella agricola TaxID=2891571 RepID=UPI001F2EC641|nr:hypothetical protein [Niabella agricola]MCF3110887.1 hypothetical protein [Niabella agricola]
MYYKDYIDQILQYYEQKKASGELPLNLSMPKPAPLRDECLIVCTERWERNDEQTLRTFFGAPVEPKTYQHIIENFDISKFKQLIKLLNNPAIETNHKNIELLAWLIDFKPRPFDRWKKEHANHLMKDAVEPAISRTDETATVDPEGPSTSSPGETGEKNTAAASGTSIPDNPINHNEGTTPFSAKMQVSQKPEFHFNPITIPVGIMALALMAVIFYQYIMGKPDEPACMYWTGDHYQSIPCNQKVYGSLVIPLDTEKLFHFKKITRPDTLTEADINRVSYIRLNGDIEFYTRKGDHPVYTERALNPLTEHIYQKHILPLKQE